MRVLVAGGGIGGIAAAISLRREGHEPVVLEQAPALGFVGQGLNLGANAVKALRYLGAFERVRESAVATTGWRYHALDGTEELVIPIGRRFGGEQYVSLHRADLLAALVDRLDPDDLRLGSRIAHIVEEPDGVTAVLEDGTEVRGDVLVGADGVKSVARRTIAPVDDSAFSGFVAWRAALPAAAVPETVARRELRLFSGQAKFCVFYPIRDDLVNLSAYVPTAESERESWTAGGDVSVLRATFAEACPEVRDALDAVEDVLLTGIYVRDPLEHWVSDRIALLGDAAHAMGPFSGNGGGAAIEDAVTLGITLRGATPGTAPARLRQYERRRMPRMTRMMLDARGRLTYLNDPDPAAPRARSGMFAGLRTLDPGATLEYGWLYEHDPVAAAESPVTGLDGAPRSRPEARQAQELWRGALTFADHAGSWRGRRAGYDRFLARAFPAPAGVTVVEGALGGVRVLRVTAPGPTSAAQRVRVLHVHGGGYMMGSAATAVEYASRLSAAVGGEVVLPEYRLAPEHPAPAAARDVRAVYRALTADGGPPVVVSGEDAGAGLALGLAVAARDAHDPQPVALFLASPFSDLSVSSPSVLAAEHGDGWLDRSSLTVLAACYLQDGDPADTEVSPVRADLHGLPPMIVCAASDEPLVDDARAIAAGVRSAGGEVDLVLVDDSVHSFVLFDRLPEAGDALSQLAGLTRAVLGVPAAS